MYNIYIYIYYICIMFYERIMSEICGIRFG